MEPFGIALPQDVAGRKIFVKHLTLMQCGCKMTYGNTKLLILSFLCIAHLIELMWIVDLYGYEKREPQQSDGVALLNKAITSGVPMPRSRKRLAYSMARCPFGLRKPVE